MRSEPDRNHHRTDADDRAQQHPGQQTEGVFTDAAEPGLRSRIIADLRALAAFLEQRPELPVSAHTSLEVVYFPHTDTDAAATGEVAEIGARLGRIPAWEGQHYVVEHACGAARYRAVAIPERVRAAYRAQLTGQGHMRSD